MHVPADHLYAYYVYVSSVAYSFGLHSGGSSYSDNNAILTTRP